MEPSGLYTFRIFLSWKRKRMYQKLKATISWQHW
jgi:hypothetical protein